KVGSLVICHLNFLHILAPWYVELANHSQAAVDAQDLTRDVVGPRACEKQNRISDFLRLAEPSEGYRPLEGLQVLLRHCKQKRCFGGTRAYAVDIDVVARHFAGQRLCKSDKAALGARIDRFTRTADSAGIAGDVHNLAAIAFHHLGQKGFDQFHRAYEVERNDLVPHIERHLPEWLYLAPAGAVYHDIDRADLALDRFGEGGDGRVIGDVEINVLGLLALLLNSDRGGLALVPGDVGYNYSCPRFGQSFSGCQADARGS